MHQWISNRVRCHVSPLRPIVWLGAALPSSTTEGLTTYTRKENNKRGNKKHMLRLRKTNSGENYNSRSARSDKRRADSARRWRWRERAARLLLRFIEPRASPRREANTLPLEVPATTGWSRPADLSQGNPAGRHCRAAAALTIQAKPIIGVRSRGVAAATTKTGSKGLFKTGQSTTYP